MIQKVRENFSHSKLLNRRRFRENEDADYRGRTSRRLRSLRDEVCDFSLFEGCSQGKYPKSTETRKQKEDNQDTRNKHKPEMLTNEEVHLMPDHTVSPSFFDLSFLVSLSLFSVQCYKFPATKLSLNCFHPFQYCPL